MSDIHGGKSKYKCLLSLIRHHSPELYGCINDLCLDGIFRSQRYKNTFLLPGKALVKKIADLIEDDKDNEATAAIKSLMLKDHFTAKSLASAKVVGTIDDKVLSAAGDVASKCKDTKMCTINSKDEPVVCILEYSGSDAPSSADGEKVESVKVGSGPKRGGAVPDSKKTVDSVVKSLTVKGDAKKTFEKFAAATAAIVAHLDNNAQVIHYLAANPILSFYFLTMNGSEHAPLKSEDFDKVDFESGLGDVDELEKLMSDVEFNRALFNKINAKRGNLLQKKGDRNTLPGELPKAYKSLIEGEDDMKLHFGKCPEVKLLMDELRFLYEDSVSDWDDVSDALVHLAAINWNDCERHSVMSDSKLYKCLVKCPEAFTSGPTLFVKSIYFMYTPINSKVEGALESSKNGGAAYGGMNPSAVSSAVFKGGAARKAMKTVKKSDKMSKLVRSLSKKQKDELKALLK
jgi:hypothetical protein